MKILHCIFLIFITTVCYANEIDNLQTNEDVCKFLVKRVSKKFKDNLPLSKSPIIIDTSKYGRNTFFKVDIDNNGLTDLIIYGISNFLAVLDIGKNNYNVCYIDGGAFLLNISTLISIDSLSIPRKIIIQQSEKPRPQIDTLIYKYNNFIEYNKKPSTNFVFEKINFKADQCFGECPVFEITINKDRTATYKAIRYNNVTGNFSGIVPSKELDELISILNYIQLDKLNNEYSVNWTDDQTVKTKIEFNEKVKIISDYGKIGTFGLSRLYSKLFYLHNQIEWK